MKNNFTLKTHLSSEIFSSFLKCESLIKKASLLIVLLTLTHFSFSQTIDNTKKIDNTKDRHFSGAISVTNNGISMIPTFSLGKPAAIFNMSMGGNRFSFDPELRFSLEGKPWSFIFWGRYKLIKTEKFQVNVGAHPAISFKTIPITNKGASKEVLVRRHYLAGELSPNYFLTKNISIGTYYLYSHGLDQYATKNTHFLALRSNFSNIKLSNQFFMRFTPQFYYLKMDENDGFYFTSGLTLSKKNFPLSGSGVINKIIQTHITASKDFVWNATLTYSFNKKYVKV
jgi:hypothetical protein